MEDQPTEMWSPVTRSLFAEELARKEKGEASEQEEAQAEGEDPLYHDTEPDRLVPAHVRLAHLEQQIQRMEQVRARARSAPSEQPLDSAPEPLEPRPAEGRSATLLGQGAPGPEPSVPAGLAEGNPTLLDPIQSGRAAQAAGEIEAPGAGLAAGGSRSTPQDSGRRAHAPSGEPAASAEGPSVLVSGQEGLLAHELDPEERRLQDTDPAATLEVLPREHSRSTRPHECRMCGRRVTTPVRRRLLTALDPAGGFRCHRCNNVFCVDHVVRTSGFLRTLLLGGRYSCQLCLMEAAR